MINENPQTQQQKNRATPFAEDEVRGIFERCVENCQACSRECAELIPHCLGMGGEVASASHIGLLQVCSQLCATSAAALNYDSRYHSSICELCAKICRACGEECERLADGDERMEDSAFVCFRCAESCSDMSEQ